MESNNLKKGVLFMSFAKGNEVKEAAEFKSYVGIGTVKVLAVNPVKDELSKIYGREVETEPKYIGETKVMVKGVEETVPQIRLDFILQTFPEKNHDIDVISRVSIFLSKAYKFNSAGDKINVINKFGETAYLPVSFMKDKILPENMSWYSTDGVRPAYQGEEDLINLLKAVVNIPAKAYKNKKTGEVVMIDNIEDAYAMLDEIQKYFTGNIKELKDIIALQPNNPFKVLFGVKTASDGKHYTDIYSHSFIKGNSTNYQYLESSVNDRKAHGGYPSTEFYIGDLKEYTVEATDLSKTNDEVPFAPTEGNDDVWN